MKRKLSIVLSFVMVLTILATGGLISASAETAEGAITFEDGQMGFIVADTSPADADPVEMAIVDFNGSKALKVVTTEGKNPHIAIDASSLLGEKIGDLRGMTLMIATEREGEKFYAVSGQIYAYSGEGRSKTNDPWSVYREAKNPNTAKSTLSEGEEMIADAFNFFVLTMETDTGAEAAGPATLYIDNILFTDADGNVIPADASAGFNAPAGFGEADVSNLAPVADEIDLGAKGTSSGWGQAAAIDSAKNGGSFDAAWIKENAVVTVYYNSANAPELILQSWTDGKPDAAGWAKVAPFTVNESGTAAQFRYDDMVIAFGSDDFATYLDKLNIGDTGADLEVSKATIGIGDLTGFAPPAAPEEKVIEILYDDLSNLVPLSDEVDLGATGTSKGWGQAVSVATLKNDGGTFDPAWLVENAVVTIFYGSEGAPEIILQSWTDGKPESAGWAKVSPFAISESGTAAQFKYEDMVAAFGTDDFATYLDKFNIGDTDPELTVGKATIGIGNFEGYVAPVMEEAVPEAEAEEEPATEVVYAELVAVKDETDFAVTGTSNNWGQAVQLDTAKNEGPFDAALLTEGAVFTVVFESENVPEMVLQSWTDGKPDSAGWAKVAPFALNAEKNTAQFNYADMLAAFGSDDFVTYLDRINFGDTGAAITIEKITFGME